LKMLTDNKTGGSTPADADKLNLTMQDEPEQGPSSKKCNLIGKAAEPLTDNKLPENQSVVTVPNAQSPPRKDEELMVQGTPLKEGREESAYAIAPDEELSQVVVPASPEILSLTPPKPLFSKLSRNVQRYNEKRVRPTSDADSDDDEPTPPVKKKMDEQKTNLGIAQLSDSLVSLKSQKSPAESSPSSGNVVEERMTSQDAGDGAFEGSPFGDGAVSKSFFDKILSYDGPSILGPSSDALWENPDVDTEDELFDEGVALDSVTPYPRDGEESEKSDAEKSATDTPAPVSNANIRISVGKPRDDSSDEEPAAQVAIPGPSHNSDSPVKRNAKAVLEGKTNVNEIPCKNIKSALFP